MPWAEVNTTLQQLWFYVIVRHESIFALLEYDRRVPSPLLRHPALMIAYYVRALLVREIILSPYIPLIELTQGEQILTVGSGR